MNATYKHLRFEEIGGNTVCRSNHSGGVLGHVDWHARWREYEFVPEPDTAYTLECLRDLADFVGKMNAARRGNTGNTGTLARDPGAAPVLVRLTSSDNGMRRCAECGLTTTRAEIKQRNFNRGFCACGGWLGATQRDDLAALEWADEFARSFPVHLHGRGRAWKACVQASHGFTAIYAHGASVYDAILELALAVHEHANAPVVGRERTHQREVRQ